MNEICYVRSRLLIIIDFWIYRLAQASISFASSGVDSKGYISNAHTTFCSVARQLWGEHIAEFYTHISRPPDVEESA